LSLCKLKRWKREKKVRNKVTKVADERKIKIKIKDTDALIS
jgi:hypothetical protein